MAGTLIKSGIFRVFHDAVIEQSNLNISVKEICRICDINRNTFYYHFPSLDYLILWGFRKGLSSRLEAQFDKERLIYNTDCLFEDNWDLAFYVDARNEEDDLVLTDFWRTFYSYMSSDADYYRAVFNCQQGAFLSKVKTNTQLMNYLFSIYYRQLYLDIRFAMQRSENIMLDDEDLAVLSMWFTNAALSLFMCDLNGVQGGEKGDGTPVSLDFTVFDKPGFRNMSHDIIKAIFNENTFLPLKPKHGGPPAAK